MPSFVKKLSAQFPDIRFLSYYTPFTFNVIVLEQFLILLLSLFLSYQFSNYTIYATIVIAYIYHIFGHLIQTIVLRKYVPGLLTGSLTSLFSIAFLKNENLSFFGSYEINKELKILLFFKHFDLFLAVIH